MNKPWLIVRQKTEPIRLINKIDEFAFERKRVKDLEFWSKKTQKQSIQKRRVMSQNAETNTVEFVDSIIKDDLIRPTRNKSTLIESTCRTENLNRLIQSERIKERNLNIKLISIVFRSKSSDLKSDPNNQAEFIIKKHTATINQFTNLQRIFGKRNNPLLQSDLNQLMINKASIELIKKDSVVSFSSIEQSLSKQFQLALKNTNFLKQELKIYRSNFHEIAKRKAEVDQDLNSQMNDINDIKGVKDDLIFMREQVDPNTRKHISIHIKDINALLVTPMLKQSFSQIQIDDNTMHRHLTELISHAETTITNLENKINRDEKNKISSQMSEHIVILQFQERRFQEAKIGREQLRFQLIEGYRNEIKDYEDKSLNKKVPLSNLVKQLWKLGQMDDETSFPKFLSPQQKQYILMLALVDYRGIDQSQQLEDKMLQKIGTNLSDLLKVLGQDRDTWDSNDIQNNLKRYVIEEAKKNLQYINEIDQEHQNLIKKQMYTIFGQNAQFLSLRKDKITDVFLYYQIQQRKIIIDKSSFTQKWQPIKGLIGNLAIKNNISHMRQNK